MTSRVPHFAMSTGSSDTVADAIVTRAKIRREAFLSRIKEAEEIKNVVSDAWTLF